MIAFPRAKDTPAVAAPELGGLARVLRAVVGVLVGIVPAVVVAIASPQPGDALAVAAGELVAVAGGHVAVNAHLALVDGGEATCALAKYCILRAGVA